MLEGLSIPRYAKAISRDNALGADNQQERPVGKNLASARREVHENESGAQSARFVEGYDFSRTVTAAKS